MTLNKDRKMAVLGLLVGAGVRDATSVKVNCKDLNAKTLD